MKKMKNMITTLCMVILLLVGITLIPAQKTGASDVTQLNVDGNWSQSFTKKGNEDVLFKFTLPCDGELSYQMMCQDSYYMYCNLCDIDFTRITNFTTYDSQTNGTSCILSAGTYFIKVTNDHDGIFKLRLNFTPYKLNDQNAVSYASPQVLSLNQSVYGALTATDKEDWFCVTVPREGTYTLSLLTQSHFTANLYDSDLSNTFDTISSYTAGHLGKISCQLQPGIYYIQVYDKDRSGQYTLNFSSKVNANTYVTIEKVSSSKNKLSVTWKPVNDVSGYQIRYSTNKAFKKNVKTVNVNGMSRNKKTISNLLSKKTYYVQVRIYYTESGKILYGKWSTTKKVVVK